MPGRTTPRSADAVSRSMMRRPGVRIVFALIAMWLLNFAISFHNEWPTLWIRSRSEIAIEAVVIVLVLVASLAWFGALRRRTLSLLSVFVIFLVLGRYAEVTAPALYGRPINLYWDAQHIPAVTAMFVKVASTWQLVLAGAALLIGLGALFVLLRFALSMIVFGLDVRWFRQGVGAVLSVTVCVYASTWFGWFEPAIRWFSVPVSLRYAQQIQLLHETMSDKTASDFSADPLPSPNLARVNGADMIVFFVESYGSTTFDRDELARGLQAARQRLAETIDRQGRQVVSAFVESPTFGGASWLAHSSFLSGFDIRDARRYNLLLTSSRETLVQRFADKGYRTLGLVPGIRNAWPEGAYYGFERLYDARQLDYGGPAFGWWRIPDQYALAAALALEASFPKQPRLLFYTTISSHAPFRPVPPYVENWSSVLSESAYSDSESRERLVGKPDWTNLGPAYRESINYVLTWVDGYLRERARKDMVLVVIGDHQPAASVTGPDASWAVPVHVIASRPAIIEALEQRGFDRGLTPTRPSIGPMHKLATHFLAAMSTPAGGSGLNQAGVDITGAVAGGKPSDKATD